MTSDLSSALEVCFKRDALDKSMFTLLLLYFISACPIDHGAGRPVRTTVGDRRSTVDRTCVAVRCCQRQTDRCRCLYRTRRRSACRDKFSNSRVWDKVSEGSTLIVGDALIYFLKILCNISQGKPVCKISSIRAAVSIQYRRVTLAPPGEYG